MPLFIGDYLGDTQRLTTEQHGAYLLMIFDYWRNGPLPDDDAALQQVTRLDRAGWKRNRPSLERFFEVSGGIWTHGRIEQEMANAVENKETRVAKAKAAAAARWNAPSNATGMPDAMLGDCPSPSPSPAKDKSLSNNSRIAKPDGVEDGVWSDFVDMRKKKRAPITETALNRIAGEAAKAGWSLNDALAECCVRGWQGFKADWVNKEGGNNGRRSGWLPR